MTDPFFNLSRRALLALEPERAHDLALIGLDRLHAWGCLKPPLSSQSMSPRQVMGLSFPNPVGLAAGLDKNGAHIPALNALGFGFIEVGTVTPRPQPGNPKPRVFRIPQAEGLINRLGFNNRGVDTLLSNIRSSKHRGILGINIGKNFDTPIERAAQDYLQAFRRVYPLASYVTLNISSPNTENLRKLQGAEALSELLGALSELRDECSRQQGRHIPIAVKIAPDLTEGALDDVADILLARRMDAVIATNTTLSREGVRQYRHGEEIGGLSGPPLRQKSIHTIESLAKRLRGQLPIIGVGGISDGESAKRALDAGASLIQLYTGLIYRGPRVIDDICKAIA